MSDDLTVSTLAVPPTLANLPADEFRMLFQSSGAALIAAGADLRVRAWNDTAARIFGASAGEMIGTPLLSILPGHRRELAEQALQAALQSGAVTEFEITDRDATGTPRELAITISPISDESGNRAGVSAFVRDITRRIRLGDELARSRKMASLGQLAGQLAHHFNNILGGIVTSVDFALAADDPRKHRRVLEQTAAGLARATSLMHSLLAFAEGDLRTGDLSDLTETLLDVTTRLESQLTAGNIRLELDLQPIGAVAVRRIPFEHVLQNLVENAMEAMPGGGVLRVATRQSADTQHIFVDVADTGCGLCPQDIEHLFEPFYSTKRSDATGESSGRGLGLAVVHGIVQFMGGNVHVSSTPGKGTVFSIELPIPV